MDDDAFDWKHTKERLKKVEKCHLDVPDQYEQYVSAKAEGESIRCSTLDNYPS